MIKTPVNGMKDILPKEMEIREFLLKTIREVYRTFGFSEIETPLVEHIENLLSKEGWDNEKLIFKILKRGEKLEKAMSDNKNDLCDSGLRYDLTLPLVRFYSNNKDKLPIPFKAMQIGNVFRADRPQKGRFRQFVQCDIDIFGDSTNLSEIDLFLATTEFLKKINFEKYNFYYEINDRNILKALIKYIDLDEKDFEEICIEIDKLDKIGIEGVRGELFKKGLDENKINKLIDLFKKYDEVKNDDIVHNINFIFETLKDYLESDVKNNLIKITNIVNEISNAKFIFNPYLVRGMGYYTGTIFEIKASDFNGSIGGGGRYDDFVKKFTNEKVCACGISIGFERIMSILLDGNFCLNENNKKIAYLLERGISDEKYKEIINEVMDLRKKGNIIYISEMAKNKRFQKENLSNLGFSEFKDCYKD